MRLFPRVVAPALLALASAAGCGDVPRIRVSVEFPDERTQLDTRALRIIVRELPSEGLGCDVLWSDAPTGLDQTERVVEYPTRIDRLAAPINLSLYPALDIFVFAHPSKDVRGTAPLAGGCKRASIDPEGATEITVALEPPP